MSKTSISILQEFAAKSNTPLPVYIEICKTGVHQNRFASQVTWNGYKAEGNGLSKKEAKQNAAKEMIELISKTSVQSGLSLPSPVEAVVQDEATIRSNFLSMRPIKKSVDTINVLQDDCKNYVGLLQVSAS